MAKVFKAQGRVELSHGGAPRWQRVGLEQSLCPGDRLRLGSRSRATVRFANQTLVDLDEGSTLVLHAAKPEETGLLELLEGALHAISRVPRQLYIRTPIVNAGVEGTELALRVDPAQAELWVYEGRVLFENTQGQLRVEGGEAALARAGEAPERRIVVKPRQAVEWALYYPPLLDSRPESYPEALRPAVLAYRRNDFTAAFAALDGVPEGSRDARYHTLRAGLLLSVGRVPEAEKDLGSAERLDPENGSAYALRSVIAVVRNEGDEALKLAAESVRLAPGSATPYVARSYAEQSVFEIELALESLEKAAELAPEDALVFARLAELELSRGDLDAALTAATKAETLDPDLARTQTVLGFAYLTRIEIDEAQAAFNRAIARDPADPLPRLGLGLAKIRDGDLDAGTEEIEIAASLDPNNSLVRSYLGKAYYEQKRGGLAETEFEQAKLLDPKDPTPWFYSAIHKQTMNRPVEALHDLEAAIDLNDNRAVYRSKLLLDEDVAARSGNLARTYDNLGFRERARLEAWKSSIFEPSNFSAHRFLADSYSTLPRHQAARVSELLQSQLLQPLNVTPIQPELAEADLAILQGAGPSELSFNEFNPLFARDGIALQANGIVGSNDTFGDDLVLSSIKGLFSGSIGQFHYETNGVRENNELDHDIYNAFGQLQLTPDLSIQAELRRRRTQNGDLGDIFSIIEPAGFNPDLEQKLEQDSQRFGFHFRPARNHNVIASYHHINSDFAQTVADRPDDSLFNADGVDSQNVDVQYQVRAKRFTPILGFSYLDGSRDQLTTRTAPERDPETDEPIRDENGNPVLKTTRSAADFHERFVSGYSYFPFHVGRAATLTLGLSADHIMGLLGARDTDKTRLNPKLGLIWSFTDDTTLRLAFFRTLKRQFWARQTLEPTHVAGFNQTFDDLNGTESTRYGVGLDHRFSDRLLAGVEGSWRDLSIPLGERVDGDESIYRAYLNWSPNQSTALTAQYNFDKLTTERGALPVHALETQQVPLSMRYFHPNGVFVRFQGTYVDQTIVRFDDFSQQERFWNIDAAVGYRFRKRYGIVAIEVRNLLDENFVHLSGIMPDEPRVPPFIADRAVFAKVNLWFY